MDDEATETTPIFNRALRSSAGMLGLYDTDTTVRAWFNQADTEADEARFPNV